MQIFSLASFLSHPPSIKTMQFPLRKVSQPHFCSTPWGSDSLLSSALLPALCMQRIKRIHSGVMVTVSFRYFSPLTVSAKLLEAFGLNHTSGLDVAEGEAIEL
jgi:hypothetical protein